MSKTDKTRPFWVRAQDYPGVTCVEEHDHRGRDCDLPKRPKDVDWRQHLRGHCAWTYSISFVCSGEGRCGCPVCSDSFGRKQQRRKDRRAARRYTKVWRDEY